VECKIYFVGFTLQRMVHILTTAVLRIKRYDRDTESFMVDHETLIPLLPFVGSEFFCITETVCPCECVARLLDVRPCSLYGVFISVH
jgi:hypothetical protein